MFNPQEHHQILPYAPRPPSAAIDRWKPAVEIAPNCPRCDSSNTKFCYYNNYSLTQPRYFCKGCRRYWTKGGSLRNVPVGGGCRKNRRGKSVRLSTDTSSVSASVENNNSHNQLNSGLRPDLALDDMVGYSSGVFSGASEGSSTTSDGSIIDLAQLYAKFLNQRPAAPIDSSLVASELPVEMDDPFELIMSSWNPNPEMAPAVEQERSSQGMMGSLSSNESQIDHGNYLGFSSDPISSYGSVGPFPDDGVLGDGFVSSCSMVPDQSLRFHPIPMVHHQDLLVGDWSPFVHSNFEPF